MVYGGGGKGRREEGEYLKEGRNRWRRKRIYLTGSRRMTGPVLADEGLPLKSKGSYLGHFLCNLAKQSKTKQKR